MKGIVDGFEDEFCIIEINGESKDIPKHQVQTGVKTGDIVEWDGHTWLTNHKQTEARIKEIKSLMNDVWEKE
ncbi:hypothetical protein J2Z69_000290 [Paenibacillus shirakamiensis]|uniref:DUF3006 domain-containing protein n=1 Tax=Paenibacillus shirakamiensis TaxID=1265935 RepID=A0ABS4JE87_9BACL|nr:DUF3006 domain-containing protein [Paenibacillus shirakamiensis]MBP1999271.1 hypothetical protein [Paenibacillus shirakamiensis]